MRKEKKWLKNEILGLSIKAQHKENNQREWHMGHEMALFDVNKLIDQLDEPEVLSQAWIDKNHFETENWAEDLYKSDGEPIDHTPHIKVIAVQDLQKQNLIVPKQDKPVVPQFVADYIEQSKKDNDSINQVFAFMDDKEDKDLWHWLFPSMYEEKRANQEVFMRAWLDGYTIEKEPQWVVKDDTGYLSYLQFSIPNIYERETSLDKNGAYKFNSKSKADLIADLVTGTVEEVTE